ncbi:hypothetical protein [Rubrobacter aplysinae]|uniref:hypothetical protein n=1 Tax=Rubrobacter aplysinae TaxID=909625 RepID=UPI00128C063C|nr:hypothetical protein [Rubrobacter aplysinae]
MSTTQSTATAATRTTRTGRGVRLFHERGHEIIRLRPWTYSVPGCTGPATYTVDARTGRCSCPDSPPECEVCKHTAAALIWRSKAGECASCGEHRLKRELVEVGEDHAVFFTDDLLCRRCAHRHGAL